MTASLAPLRRCCFQQFRRIEYRSLQPLGILEHLKHSLFISPSQIFTKYYHLSHRSPTTPATPLSKLTKSSSGSGSGSGIGGRTNQNVVSLALFIATGVGIYVYFKNE
ncbi:hypothetical protein PCASD_10747 [Puccinia coronata f. sp. avenae]|uniref:Uncharacterized protein n=1 Tax=Puccinia coronata f. sp. avenae TaxID=200324 RepID=A0A2N5UT30_9BASI|nr:hypothetical protein PCASD_10747 [Puccinia coronata f. sp. avenae]